MATVNAHDPDEMREMVDNQRNRRMESDQRKQLARFNDRVSSEEIATSEGV